MSWFYYLLEANLYLGTLYIFYRMCLQRRTFYMLNRMFLLVIPFLAFVIPLVTIEQKLVLPMPTDVGLVETSVVMLDDGATVESNVKVDAGVNWASAVFITYMSIAGFFLLKIGWSLVCLLRLYRDGTKKREGNITMVRMPRDRGAFSFFHWMFLPQAIEQHPAVIKHEEVHIRQWHSVDVLVYEIFRVICWFNPLIHLLVRDVKLNHEYLADEQASRNLDAYDYAMLLIANAYQSEIHMLSNPIFNRSQLKNRLDMLEKQKSAGKSKFNYLLAVPLMIILFSISAFAVKKDYGFVINSAPEWLDKELNLIGESPFVLRTDSLNEVANKEFDAGMRGSVAISDSIKHKNIASINKANPQEFSVFYMGADGDTLYVSKGYYEINPERPHQIALGNIYIIDTISNKREGGTREIILIEDGKYIKTFDKRLSFISRGESKVYMGKKSQLAPQVSSDSVVSRLEKVNSFAATALPDKSSPGEHAIVVLGMYHVDTLFIGSADYGLSQNGELRINSKNVFLVKGDREKEEKNRRLVVIKNGSEVNILSWNAKVEVIAPGSKLHIVSANQASEKDTYRSLSNEDAPTVGELLAKNESSIKVETVLPRNLGWTLKIRENQYRIDLRVFDQESHLVYNDTNYRQDWDGRYGNAGHKKGEYLSVGNYNVISRFYDEDNQFVKESRMELALD